jgi:hypothetical protein
MDSLLTRGYADPELAGDSSRTVQRTDPGSREGEPCERSLW